MKWLQEKHDRLLMMAIIIMLAITIINTLTGSNHYHKAIDAQIHDFINAGARFTATDGARLEARIAKLEAANEGKK